MKQTLSLSRLLLLFLVAVQLTSCKKDEKEPDVLASFTYTIDASDFKKVSFTSTSQNYASISWNFGDNSALSSETAPVHIYAAVGQYTVNLTATSPGGVTDVYTAVINISDPNAELTKLVGEDSKTWKLLRDVSTGRYPLEVGPAAHNTIWWAMGKDNDELANRPCVLNDEWTFSRDGKMVYDAKGDYWAEGGVFNPSNVCASTDNMTGLLGQDLTAWGNGTHSFELNTGAEPTLKVIGLGAFIGLCKAATGAEVTEPQESVTYHLIKLTDGDVDTLIIQTDYMTGGSAPQPAYWRFVLVHYDNPADEPPIPGPAPSLGFSIELNGLTLTCTNTTTDATSYLWDFGDGQTSTEMAPVHTYAHGGAFNVKLTASNANGQAVGTKLAFVATSAVTDAILRGNAWKVRVDDYSIFVGPGMGSTEWWSVPKNFLDGSSTGVDDWSCITDDEFTFSAGGVYTYNTNGSARNDGYFGSPNGCISDAEIAASGNGAAFGSGTHSYVFSPAKRDQRALITLTNGATGAAFIGFYKGYYGGENTDGAVAPNGGNLTNTYEVMGYANTGTKEYLFLSVDYSATHDGSQGWSVILER